MRALAYCCPSAGCGSYGMCEVFCPLSCSKGGGVKGKGEAGQAVEDKKYSGTSKERDIAYKAYLSQLQKGSQRKSRGDFYAAKFPLGQGIKMAATAKFLTQDEAFEWLGENQEVVKPPEPTEREY